MERGVVTVRLDDGQMIHRETGVVPRITDDVIVRLMVDAQQIVLVGVTRTMDDGSVVVYGPHRIADVTISREHIPDPLTRESSP